MQKNIAELSTTDFRKIFPVCRENVREIIRQGNPDYKPSAAELQWLTKTNIYNLTNPYPTLAGNSCPNPAWDLLSSPPTGQPNLNNMPDVLFKNLPKFGKN